MTGQVVRLMEDKGFGFNQGEDGEDTSSIKPPWRTVCTFARAKAGVACSTEGHVSRRAVVFAPTGSATLSVVRS